MPRKPTRFQKIIMKAKRYPIEGQIKTKEEAQIVHDLALEELQRRRDFFEQYKTNIRTDELTINNKPELHFKILGPNNIEIAKIELSNQGKNIWILESVSTGDFLPSQKIYRDLGFARVLIEKAIKELKQLGAKRLEFKAVLGTTKWYKSLGAKYQNGKIIQIVNKIGFGTVPMYFDLMK
jgi:GNAT superfamily N-acetyltransferase